MPAKQIITKRMILESAMEILKTEGLDGLNARNIAKKICCSTQPIYKIFTSMEELKKSLKEQCQKTYFTYVENSQEETLFLKYLLSLVTFAYDFPQYFKFLYMDNPYEETAEEKNFQEMIIQKIMVLGNMSHEKATKFYLSGFIFAYGLASQIVSGYIIWDKNTMRDLLFNHFKSLKLMFGD